MKRYSYEEIRDFILIYKIVPNTPVPMDFFPILEQIFEENQILRQAFVEITQRPPAYAGKIPIMSHVEMIQRAKKIEDIAYEALMKAAQIGEEK